MWGSKLLDTQHLSQKKGWKLPDDRISWLDFSTRKHSPPATLAKFDHSWTSYYHRRGLPLESPARLLLHWPLTVYRLLDLLHLIPSDIPQERRKLTIHCVGIEKELDFVPIYGELALLFPNTDLDLIFFGQGVPHLLAAVKKSCLAT